MYGTVARMRIKPDAESGLLAELEGDVNRVPGFVSSQLYRSDADPREFYLAVAFEDRESYRKNADSPEQNERYLKMRDLLEADPEWHDGEIVRTATRPEAKV
jgi:quinol monooxygenase YgiN